MLALRKILLSNKIYYLILIITLLITCFRIILPKKSVYNQKFLKVSAIITNIKATTTKLELELKAQEKLKAIFYFQENKKIPNLNLGDKVNVKGEFYLPSKNTTKHLFNYQKYLNNQNIFYLIDISKIEVVSKNKNFYYCLKQNLIDSLAGNAYLSTFILGDKSNIDKNVITSYQENGISHLFAISGMHITLLANLISKVLKKMKLQETTLFKITSLVLFCYLLLIGFSPSILRGVLFYYLFSINKIYYFNVKSLNIFMLVLSISLLINPNYLFDIGFQYSYLISFALLYFHEQLSSKSYFQGLLKVSLIAFLISIPITLSNFNQINILSIFYNLLFVPLISILIFPLALLTFIFKPLLPIFNFLITILESLSLFFSNISFGKFIFKEIPILIYLIYLIIIFLLIKTHKKIYLLSLLLILVIHYFLPNINSKISVNFFDVGQGDSILLTLKSKNVLIDTGGALTKTGNIYNNILKPALKSLGVKRLNYLILTHGDADHMGEAISLVKNFKVENVIFNCGPYNDLEKELIKVLNNKKTKYYSCIQELNIDKYKFQFLNTKIYNNENDNSNVIYFNYNNYKFLFMGDAGIEREKDILDKYNLPNIDVLKIGHHGSKTSSGKKFIDEINPKYSIISVGENNLYGHPNDNVLDNLDNSKIYRTDQDGSIVLKIDNNKLQIETCAP